MSTHRTYTLRVRAERRRETRERIVAATESLHGEVGPARTTIADVARRAGVERLTVYNHFPELHQLLEACQANFLAAHPPPDLSPHGVSKSGAVDRLESVLVQLYGWFRENEAMERNIHRDRHLMPELDHLLHKTVDPVFDRTASDYAKLIATSPQTVARTGPMIRVALDFRTWQLVAGSDGSDVEAARLLARAIAGVA